tara:strand:- start:8374 stop:8481 length:108 start_codon:yes stop_codon:yes gene_type:complete
MNLFKTQRIMMWLENSRDIGLAIIGERVNVGAINA